MKKTILRLIIAAGIFAAAMFTPEPMNLYVFIAAYLVIGYDVLFYAAKGIFGGNPLDESFLMSIATFGAFFIGEYPEAVMVMFFYQVGEAFAAYAESRARKSVRSLSELIPGQVTVRRGGETLKISAEEIVPGDIMIILPGEKIAADGVLSKGVTAFDTKALTGESIPREAEIGAEVLSGFINLTGAVEITAKKAVTESAAAVIAELTETAADKKAAPERFITKFAKIYTPVVVGAAVLLAAVPMLIAGHYEETYLYRALSFLVVSCPCALVLSVPLSYFAGIGAGSRRGFLIKGGSVFETLAETTNAVFDKTGTLTKGELKVKEIVPAAGYSESDVLRLAAIAESGSNHPIAKSIKKAFGGEIKEDAEITETAGSGVSAKLSDGRIIKVGKAENGGVEVTENGALCGRIILGDSVRDTAQKAIARLTRLGIKTHMLTGDSAKNAEAVSSELGLSSFAANLMPEDKLNELQNIKKSAHGKVIFTGDGINDAPVLAAADAGLSMGGIGQAAAVEASDVVITDDNPEKVAEAIILAKRVRVIVIENIAFSLTVKFAILILSALGITGLDLAVFADVGVSVIAVLNALRVQTLRRSAA
jgi:Cd2+/Zn2+-exporting ATPase